jgi:putative adhesin/cell wall-active antibiotic response 4TMS protein YvqF
MRRGSIVGPIILILVGLLFLANNLRPDVPMLEFLGQYWPFLLIGWGLVRLVEILIWAFRGKPLPAKGVSGGEWVLVVFLTIVGSGLYAFHSRMGWWGPSRFRMHGIEMFGEAFDYTIDEQKVTAGKTPRIILENLRGNVRITGGDTTEVRVNGRKTVRSMTREEADRVNNSTTLEVLQQADSILVRTNQNRAQDERYVTADLEIMAPAGASLQARTRDGDYDINDLQGNVEIDSDRSGVRVQNLGGSLHVNVRRSDMIRAQGVKGTVDLQGRGNDVELESVQGQVTIDGSWGGELHFRDIAKPLRFQGMQAELQVQRVNGEMRLGRGFFNGESVTGPIVLRGHNKGCCDVHLSDYNSSLDLTLQRGDVDLRPALPLSKTDIDVRSGNVDLAIPRGAKFTLKARVDKGDIENDYGDTLRQTSESRGATLVGAVGDGPAVSITSERGTVTVRKSEGAPPSSPLTPQPPTAPVKPAKAEIN